MKRSTRILPEHIPDGQRYNEASLAELNDALRRCAGKGLVVMLGVIIGLLLLAVGSAKLIGGVAGYGLSAVLMIFMPASMGLVMRFSSKEYIEAAGRAGLSKQQLAEAIRNRNRSVAAWGTLPEVDPTLSKEEIKAVKKLRLKKVLTVMGMIVAIGAVGMIVYDNYRSKMSNRAVFELRTEAGISKADSKQIIAILEKRFKRLKEIRHSDMPKPTYTLKNGKLTCLNYSNILTEYICDYFFLQGELALVGEEGEILAGETDMEQVTYVENDPDKPGTLAITLTESAFKRLQGADGSVSLRSGDKIPEKLSFSSPNRLSAEWLAEHADGTTCYIDSVLVEVYIAYLEKLPVELEVRKS